MTVTVDEIANERSRIKIPVYVYDSDGNAVTPTSLKWSLSDTAGVEINSRTQIVVTGMASPINIMLYGADLAVTEAADIVTRLLTIEAAYNETGYTGLPFNEVYQFQVRNLVKLPIAESGGSSVTLGGESVTIGGEDATWQGQ